MFFARVLIIAVLLPLAACQTLPDIPPEELSLGCGHNINQYFPEDSTVVMSYGAVKNWLSKVSVDGPVSPFAKKTTAWVLRGITTGDKQVRKTGRYFYIQIGSSWTNTGSAYEVAFRPNGRFYVLEIPAKHERKVGYSPETLDYRLFHCPL